MTKNDRKKLFCHFFNTNITKWGFIVRVAKVLERPMR